MIKVVVQIANGRKLIFDLHPPKTIETASPKPFYLVIILLIQNRYGSYSQKYKTDMEAPYSNKCFSKSLSVNWTFAFIDLSLLLLMYLNDLLLVFLIYSITQPIQVYEYQKASRSVKRAMHARPILCWRFLYGYREIWNIICGISLLLDGPTLFK